MKLTWSVYMKLCVSGTVLGTVRSIRACIQAHIHVQKKEDEFTWNNGRAKDYQLWNFQNGEQINGCPALGTRGR